MNWFHRVRAKFSHKRYLGSPSITIPLRSQKVDLVVFGANNFGTCVWWVKIFYGASRTPNGWWWFQNLNDAIVFQNRVSWRLIQFTNMIILQRSGFKTINQQFQLLYDEDSFGLLHCWVCLPRVGKLPLLQHTAGVILCLIVMIKYNFIRNK